MRTRLSGLVLLLALLVLPAAAASAAPALAAADTTVLATEAGPPSGLEPRLADNPDNAFRPEDYEEPWTYWLGVFVLAGTIPAIGLVGYLYYVLVHRHRDPAKAGAR